MGKQEVKIIATSTAGGMVEGKEYVVGESLAKTLYELNRAKYEDERLNVDLLEEEKDDAPSKRPSKTATKKTTTKKS